MLDNIRIRGAISLMNTSAPALLLAQTQRPAPGLWVRGLNVRVPEGCWLAAALRGAAPRDGMAWWVFGRAPAAV